MFFFEKLENTPEAIVDIFRFKAVRTLPKNEHVNGLLTDLHDMVHNIEFKKS